MNSKTIYDTEDKIAYNFFENVTTFRDKIEEALKQIRKINANINKQISNFGFKTLDEDLPNLGITLNNKLVEIYQQFKENRINVFAKQDLNAQFELGIVPMLVINSVIVRVVDIYENEMGTYIQEAEGLNKQKEENKEKLKEKNLITVLITVIRTVFNDDLAKKFYFDESEVEALRGKIKEYKKLTENIYNYDFKQDIIDIIAEGLTSQNLSLEVIEDILNSEVADALEKLGLSNQMPVLRQKIDQIIKSQNDSKNTWELSKEEKERANDYDSRDENIIIVTLEEDYEK